MNIQERKNKDGKVTSYRVRVFDHRDVTTGKQVFKTLSVKYEPTKSEDWNRKNAQKQGAIFENAVEEHTTATSTTTFDTYADYMIATKVQRETLATSTAFVYQYRKKRLAPFIGHSQIKELTPNALNKAYNDMFKAGLSAKTVHSLHAFLHSVLQMAFSESLIPRNYAAAAIPPKCDTSKVVALTEEELKAFYTALYSNKRYYEKQVLFCLLLASGCRIGEICALSWNHVDFNEGKIIINQHFINDKFGWRVKSGCKTTSGERWVYLDESIMQMLAEYRSYQAGKAQEHGSKWNHSANAVFTSIKDFGNFLQPNGVREFLKRFMRNHNLPHATPHQFRHSAVSLQLQEGISIADIAKRAGHANPNVTLSIYSHTLKDNNRHCSEAVTKILPRLPQAEKLTIC